MIFYTKLPKYFSMLKYGGRKVVSMTLLKDEMSPPIIATTRHFPILHSHLMTPLNNPLELSTKTFIKLCLSPSCTIGQKCSSGVEELCAFSACWPGGLVKKVEKSQDQWAPNGAGRRKEENKNPKNSFKETSLSVEWTVRKNRQEHMHGQYVVF